MIRIGMIPSLSNFDNDESGIKRVVEAYIKHLPEFDIQVGPADKPFDILAIHAGVATRIPNDVLLVAHLHGLYWTADYEAAQWEWRANADVIASAIAADVITVPSPWVAESIQRDLRINPVVIPHGIDWQDWQEPVETVDYVLFNKNRSADVCNPAAVGELAAIFPEVDFVTTFAPSRQYSNVIVTGLKPHNIMKDMVKQAMVYLSTAKETFAIGVLEAMAAGVPILTANHGNVPVLAPHGVCGYTYERNNIKDMAEGLRYCMKYRRILSDNARESAKKYTWQNACGKLADVYRSIL